MQMIGPLPVLSGKDEIFLQKMREFYSAQYDILIAITENPHISYRELAEKFSIPVGTVRSRLHRIRKKIAEWQTEGKLPIRNGYFASEPVLYAEIERETV